MDDYVDWRTRPFFFFFFPSRASDAVLFFLSFRAELGREVLRPLSFLLREEAPFEPLLLLLSNSAVLLHVG